MFEYSNHLGFFNPFYKLDDKNGLVISNDLAEILKGKEERHLDVLSVIELLNRNFMFGDRTLIQGIHRTPWMAKPDEAKREFVFHDLPMHTEIDQDEAVIADELFERLQNEMLSYIGSKTNIGILLSGGMDSRIVAGILDHLIKTGKTAKDINVVALTWGNENSRDVVYSKEIAKRLNWEWKHYIVSAEDMLNNIHETALQGCEFSPMHLHALPQIRVDNNFDCVLAGSYGDSVGRAEYSSVTIRNLKPVYKGLRNVSFFLKEKAFNDHKGQWLNDFDRYHKLFPQAEVYQEAELDLQLHYMRRMLNPCMSFIGEHNNLFQAFTSPEVFGYMWSLKPERRNNTIYKLILDKLTTNITDIPWARTGLPYGVTTGEPDKYNKSHHSYQDLINKDLFETVKKMVLSDEIRSLDIFNMAALEKSLHLIRTKPHTKRWFEEQLAWVASLAKAVALYNITPDKHYSEKLTDRINGNILTTMEFYGRNGSVSKILKKI